MGDKYKGLQPDTVPTEAVSHEDATLILLQRKVGTALDGLVGEPAFKASQRIKTYTHSEDDLPLYIQELRGAFRKDTDLANSASKILVNDLKKCITESLKTGTTYSTAVEKVKAMDPEYSPFDLTRILKENLDCGNEFAPGFPGFLTVLWALKMNRPRTYENSLHAAKWSDAEGATVNTYNSKNDISQRVERERLFVYSAAVKLGALSHLAPDIESDQKLTDTKQLKLISIGPETKSIMYSTGFPESEILEEVMAYIDIPSAYTERKSNYDWATATLIGVMAAARQFEGRFYGRGHRKERFTVKQVFDDIGKLFFKPKELAEVKKILNRGYRYNEDQAWQFPLLQSYAMLNLLIGTLDKEEWK